MILETTVEKIIKDNDRCDACIQKAAYMVTFITGDLYFCNHHFHKGENTFLKIALNIYDESDTDLMAPVATPSGTP